MSRAMVFGGALALAAVAIVSWRFSQVSRELDSPFEPTSRVIEAAPLCPWRESEGDLRLFFPEANRHATETRILSGLRLELAKQLGRQPNAEENSLTFHRVFKNSEPLGAVLARRVKGEHGGIEVVLAITERGEVLGVRLQRLREPTAAASALQSRTWLTRFQGRTHERGWEADDFSELSPEVRVSGQAVREGIRSLLILWAASEGLYSPSVTKRHH